MTNRQKQHGYTLVELITSIGGLALAIAVGFVVVHFIAKFW